jgi:hypothetical protein
MDAGFRYIHNEKKTDNIIIINNKKKKNKNNHNANNGKMKNYEASCQSQMWNCTRNETTIDKNDCSTEMIKT